MQLNEIVAWSEDQNRGRWFELPDPVTGKPTGIRLKIVGPDSETQRRATLRLADDLADLADSDGLVSPEAREKARLNNLARCVVDWEILEDDSSVPFGFANVLRFLKAAQWVQVWVDAMASDRAAHRGNV
jgi:hypothetical protein